MSADAAILADNTAQLQRLESLVVRLGDTNHNLDDGWTVAAILAHLAFWDRRAVLLLQRWERHGTPPDGPDMDLLNEALLEEWRALPPRRAADLAVTAARTVNRTVEALHARVWDAIQARGSDWLVHRARHRREHLDQIERAVRG